MLRVTSESALGPQRPETFARGVSMKVSIATFLIVLKSGRSAEI